MKNEEGAMIKHLKEQAEKAKTAPAEEGAMISHLKRQQEKVQSQIDKVVEFSPAMPTKKVSAPRAPLSIDEMYSRIAPASVDPDTAKMVVPNARLDGGFGGTGTPYGAYRDDAMSPATQNRSAANVTSNPNDIYIGGRVPMGSNVNAAFTGEEDTFYLKKKFEPVKPYPLTYPNGRTMEVDTANMDKAAWLYYGLMEPANPVDFFGYYKMPNTPKKEGFVHGFARGAVNFLPGLITSVAGFGAQTFNDIEELFHSAIGDKSGAAYYNAAGKLARQTTDDLMKDLTWQYGPEGVEDTYGNKAGYIFGQVAPMAAMAFSSMPASLSAMSVAEAADSARIVRNAMMDKGWSTGKSLAAATGTGAGVYLIGMLPEYVTNITFPALRGSKSLVKLMKESPQELRKLFRQKNLVTALTESLLSEPEQDIFTSVVAGEDIDWEAALYTALSSFMVTTATLKITSPDPEKAIRENVTRFKKFFDDHQEFMDMIVTGSNGAITRENIDEVLDALGSPEHSGDLLNYLKEGIVANFDKLTDDQKKQLMKRVKKLDPDSDLGAEFNKLDQRIDQMLTESAEEDEKAGRQPLTEDQRNLVKLMLRGVAAQQLAYYNVLPSQMSIPQNVFGGFANKRLSNVAEAGFDTETNQVVVNNALPESSLPVGTVMPAVVEGSRNQRASAEVKNQFAAAGVSSEQSLGFANLPHEFWHWIETMTDLPKVGEFMASIQQLAEQIVPGITAGKSGVGLSEAYAYAIGMAGEKVKTALGLTGPAADYVDFMNLAFNAEDIAQGTRAALKAYMDSYRNVLKANKSLIDDVLKGYGTPQLRGAIDNFVKTGNPGALKFDDMRALNAALSTAVDSETADKLGQIFESQPKAESFMQRYAQEYDNLLAQDREGAASRMEEYRRIANEKVGVAKEVTPGTSREDTFEQKANQIISETPADVTKPANEEKPVQKENAEQPKQEEGLEIESRKRLNDEPYDVDELVKGTYDDAPDIMVGYLENAAKWNKEEGTTKEDLRNRTVKLSAIEGQLQIKLNPSFGNSRKDHRAAYVILAKNKLKQMNEKGLLTEEHKRRAKDTEMFAVRSKYVDRSRKAMDYLAVQIAENKATPDEEALYTALASFDAQMSNLYVDFGPYTPVETARAAKTAAEELAYSLALLQNSKDESVRTILRGESVMYNGKKYGGEDFMAGMLPAQVDRMLNFGAMPYYRPAYNKKGETIGYVKSQRYDSLEDAVWDYVLALESFLEDRQFEEERQQSVDTSKTDSVKNPIKKFFDVDYDAQDVSDKYIDTSVLKIAQSIIDSSKTSDQWKAQAQRVIDARGQMASYRNPARSFINRDIINTPTPLEQIGMSMEEAEEKIRKAGLVPYDFLNGKLAEKARETLTPEKIRKSLASDNPDVFMKTRRNMLARLLQEVPSIGSETDEPTRLMILHAVSSAKAAVDQIFQDYINSDDNFNANPTGDREASALVSAEDFKASDRFGTKLEEHKAMGYTEEVDASNLDVSDEIAFPYGNNMFRGVISFKGRTPAGNTTFIILEDVDIAEWRAKDFASMTKPPRQLRISEKDLRNVGFMRKPLEVANFNKYADLVSLFDDICANHEDWVNYTRLAQASVAEAEEDMELRSQLRKTGTVEIESDEDAEYDENDPEQEYYAVRSNTTDIPEIDPGAFALIDNNMTDEDWATILGGTEEEITRRLESLEATGADKLALWQMREAKVENTRQQFAPYGAALKGAIETLRNGLAERKIGRWGKALLVGGWQSGLDRKLRMIFGDGVNKLFNFVLQASHAQELSEGLRHAYDKAITDNVFNGSRVAYERWVAKIPTETYDAELTNGTTQQVTKDEILSMAIAKRAVEKNLIDTYNYTDPEARMRGFYKNFDELLSHMTDEDWKFVDVALEALASARGQEDTLPAYWAPSALASDYTRNGWGNRLVNTPDNGVRIVSSMEPLAATGAYQSVLSIIGSRALKDSGLPKSLRSLHDILVFEDIDLSYFKTLDEAEVAVYNDIKSQAAQLKAELEQAIGPQMVKWLIDNINVDLKFNPLVKDLAKNPVMGAFQKATRNVASSLLMGNIKQGYVNLGNYDLFLGLSNSGMARFYTIDRVNAWAHIRDAWKLAMDIPEFKRRLEQSGLSEQMRRVADMNEDSFLRDIQQALYKGGKGKAGDIVGAINTLGKISAKYGLATNVVPDLVGIALGTYAVWDDVLARNGGNVQKAQDEIVTHVLNRVSSSNYETRSAATKLLNRAGLEALVAFKNDQLQKVGMMCEAAMRLMNSSDPAVREKAWKDIKAGAYSTLRYIAIQAGWIAAMIQLLSGHDLDDEEKKYLYEATVRETLSQLGDTTQVGSFIVPIFTGIYEGRDMGTTLLPIAGIQRANVAARKGNIIKMLSEIGALTGVTPVAPASVRLLDSLYKQIAGDEKEQAVGRLMALGRSEPTAEKMLGYSRGQKTGKLRNKKSKKESD